MPACLGCRTLVDTNVLLYVVCCPVRGRLKVVRLSLRYVERVAFRAWFVRSYVRRIKAGSKTKNFVVVCSSEAIWLAELMIQLALTVSSQEEHLPNSHVHVAVGTPQGHDLD